MNLTLTDYLFYCSLIIFILFVIVSNTNTKKPMKEAGGKPKLKPMKIFKDGKNGMSDREIKEHFKL